MYYFVLKIIDRVRRLFKSFVSKLINLRFKAINQFFFNSFLIDKGGSMTRWSSSLSRLELGAALVFLILVAGIRAGKLFFLN